MKTFALITLGCRTNQYESQALREQLLGIGCMEVERDADVCIVNTCTVTALADRSCRSAIRSAREAHPRSFLIVTGCGAVGNPLLKAEMPMIDRLEPDKTVLVHSLYPDSLIPPFRVTQLEGHTRAFVKIQDGCNQYCTYCIVPYVRGRSRSRPLTEITEEIQAILDRGTKEIVLTGINIGDYQEGPHRLSDVIHAVHQLPGLHRLRISSVAPRDITSELFELLVTSPSVCPHLHLVLQSGSDAVLKAMRREYTRDDFLTIIQAIRARCPEYTFTTDIIVGFPKETEEDFEETLSLVDEGLFIKVHGFPYSPRSGTWSARWKTLPSTVVQERKTRLAEAAQRAAYRIREGFLGKTTSVLIEYEDQGYYIGHTPHFFTVRMKGGGLRSNMIVPVRLTGHQEEYFIGETCDRSA